MPLRGAAAPQYKEIAASIILSGYPLLATRALTTHKLSCALPSALDGSGVFDKGAFT